MGNSQEQRESDEEPTPGYLCGWEHCGSSEDPFAHLKTAGKNGNMAALSTSLGSRNDNNDKNAKAK